jgi:hypothetical protein
MMERSTIIKISLVILIIICTFVIFIRHNNSLLDRIANLERSNEELQFQLNITKEPAFYDFNKENIDYYWKDPPYIRFKGTVFNAGLVDVSNLTLTINLWDPVGWLITSKTFQLGPMEGRTYQNYDLNVEYFRKVDKITFLFEYEED